MFGNSTCRAATDQTRRALLSALPAFAVSPSVFASTSQQPTLVEVWRSPTCACCVDWIKHLEQHGFRVLAHDVGNNARRAQLQIPNALGSCHTATVAGYAVEGHVPAREIQRMLSERPKAIGLVVPGMPLGSPGMDGEKYDFRTQPYRVLLLHHDLKTSVYQSYK